LIKIWIAFSTELANPCWRIKAPKPFDKTRKRTFMGGWEEDMDDVAMQVAEEEMERRDLEERLATPHCICQSALTWDQSLRAWLCHTPNCQWKH